MGNNETAYHKLTHPQKRILYMGKINTNSPLHNIGGCLIIHKTIDVEIMKQTISFIIKNNDGLRLRITELENQVFQYVSEFQDEEIDFVDFSNCENPQNSHQKWANELFRTCFNLNDSKLYYFAVYKISEMEYGVLLNIHHIIADGWSITLLEKQICEIYKKLLHKEDTYTNNSSYLDFIRYEEEYLNSERFIKNRNFWNEKFIHLPEEFLYKTSNSLKGNRQSFNIDTKLSKKIKGFSDEVKCSLNTFFITVLIIYINKITCKKSIVIGTPVLNRTNKEQKKMIGMFTSTVPFMFEIDTSMSIKELTKLVNKELKLCLLNQKYPYDSLIKELELGKMGYDSLFKMCVNYYNSKYDDNIDEIDVEVREYYCGNQSYSLQLTVKEWEEDNITLNFDYKTLEYSDSEIKAMYNALINIINRIVTDRNISVNDLQLVSKEECNYKVYDLNLTTSNYPNKRVCELFEAQVAKTPNKVALEFKEETLTYEELNDRTNQLANWLIEKGIDSKSIVAIIQTHSFELVISILACIKAGAAYLPIDPSYPVERINYMLNNSQSNMMLTNYIIADVIEFNGYKININDLDVSEYSKSNLRKNNNLSDLAYVIYTSGSTGKPKGVMIEHQGLTNYIWWANKVYLKNEEESMALYSSISFDLTVTSIFTPLISGSKVVIYDNENEFVLYKILKENKSTVVKLTPAHLNLLKDMDNTKSSIKRFIVGGEDLKVNLAKEVSDSFGKKIEIFNEYGPTETVVGCMIYKYDEEKDTSVSVPIGYPADNMKIYILDNELKPVSTGFIGEIYISGDGVARGYLNKEELTREKFIDNPFVSGKTMYRTGDMARYLDNGAIEYVGRSDNQVKIRGHRIEIGEIERYLMENECVKDAVVIFKEDLRGHKLLNAYVVSKKEIESLDLRRWMLKFLPNYMIPNNFIFMNTLPLTINGKVDYSLLPMPEVAEKKFIQYETIAEKKLVEVIEEILKIENISMNDNFHQLGGDSIKAIQISSKLNNMGLNIKVKDILAYESIGEIAATIESGEVSRFISQEKCEGSVEKTPIIEWFFNQEFKNKNGYSQYVLLKYLGIIEISKVLFAVRKLIEHHDALRLNYDKNRNKLFYTDKSFSENSIFKYYSIVQYSYIEQCEFINNLINKTSNDFEIETSSLFKIHLIDLGDNSQAILFKAHHLIVDGISWRIILDDFLNIIKQLNEGSEIQLPLKTCSYKEWAQDLIEYSKNDFNDEIRYWNDILNKKINYNIAPYNEEDIYRFSNVLDDEIDERTLNDLIYKSNEIYNIDLNEILVIGLVLTLHKLTKSKEIIIEIERHGREDINDHIDVSRTVGWFTSMYPAYFNIVHDDIEDNIKSVKEQLKGIPNNGFNYGILKFLRNELICEDKKYVRLNYLGEFDNIIDDEKLNVSYIEFGLKCDMDNSMTALLDINAMVINKRLKLTFEYNKRRFNDKAILKFIECYIDTLKSIVNICMNKHLKEYTPSDFDTVDISQEDLDSLFD